jgi:hypothetical protein
MGAATANWNAPKHRFVWGHRRRHQRHQRPRRPYRFGFVVKTLWM